MHKTMFLLVVFACGMVYAASTCSYDGYRQACQHCSFDQYGTMNQTCYEGYQANAQVCVGAAYPNLATQHLLGGCPAVDSCVSNLQLCKNLRTTGNDSEDCQYGEIDSCFREADACAALADKNCSSVDKTNGTGEVLSYFNEMCFWISIVLMLGVFAAYAEHSG